MRKDHTHSFEHRDAILIVQPWFTAHGHPAQSTLNTARVLRDTIDVTYLVSVQRNVKPFHQMLQELQEIGSVETFDVPSPSVRIGTFVALLHLIRRSHRPTDVIPVIFFLDVHLLTVVLFWPFVSKLVRTRRLALLYLMGPERIIKHRSLRHLVSRFLQREEVRLFLRTDELREGWIKAFREVQTDRIGVLPSLEIPTVEFPAASPLPSKHLRFGIIGQIRIGKGIERLIPIFKTNPNLGVLTVAGTFFDLKQREAMPELIDYPHFHNKFLTEDEIVGLAQAQDYMLILYENWDERMEVATFYFAARVNRPVIVYGRGWCARIVRSFHCGLIAPDDPDELPLFLSRLPLGGTSKYNDLLAGMARFRSANSGNNLRDQFFSKLLNN
jgi:hypothetical protein